MVDLDTALVTALEPGGLGPSDLLHMVRKESIDEKLVLVGPNGLGDDILNLSFPMLGRGFASNIGEFDSRAPFTAVVIIRARAFGDGAGGGGCVIFGVIVVGVLE